MKLSQIVKLFGGILEGEDFEISAIAPIDIAKKGELTFLSHSKYRKILNDTNASAVIVSSKDSSELKIPKIISSNPYFYFCQLSNYFYPRKIIYTTVDPTAVIGINTKVNNNCGIGAMVVIGNNCTIGERVEIYPGTVIGDNVKIADDVIIYPNVTIYNEVSIGQKCILHAGCVLGSDGFGNALDEKKHWHKIPQIGGVIIGQNVEIGANTTIDGGTLSPTIIEDGVHIDNLVQIAHNVKIGAHTAIAANAGIAGGAVIGKHCQIAGGVGITGHITIADFTVIGGASNVAKNIDHPDLYSSAIPVFNFKQWARLMVHFKNLEQLNQRVKDLESSLIKDQ